MRNIHRAFLIVFFVIVLAGRAFPAWSQSFVPPFSPPDPSTMKENTKTFDPSSPPPAPGSTEPLPTPVNSPGENPPGENSPEERPPSLQQLTGQIVGRVVAKDSRGRADESKGLAGVAIQISDGTNWRNCVTERGGYFSVEGLNPGRATVTASRTGYSSSQGEITIVDGAQRRVLIAMTPLFSTEGSKKERGYINIYAYGKYDYEGKWIGVESIKVHEKRSYSRRWSKFFNAGAGSGYVTLACSGAEIGDYYQVQVKWSDGTVRTSEFKLSQKYRDITISL
ncbi:MAG: carboxypeptidase-like regulatory domain-containing protein [Vulcanimicrobiota bacterium]